MIKLTSMAKQAILAVISALHKVLDKVESPAPEDVVIVNTSTSPDAVCASSGGGAVLVYGENTEVQPLSYLDIYTFTDKELITKYFADEAVRDFKATHTYEVNIEKNLDIWVAYADTTYTCSEDYLLHIYCIGGGGGFTYDDLDWSIYGKGQDGEVAYATYLSSNGENIDITIGAEGVNKTDVATSAGGTFTHCNSTSTTFSLTGAGGQVGILGNNYVAPTLERHCYCCNGVTATYYGYGNQSSGNHCTTLRSIVVGGTVYYRAESTGAYTAAYVYRSPGIGGLSGNYEDLLIEESAPPTAGCVIIIKELLCI